MVSLNRSLVELVKNNLISKKNALNYAINPVELRRMLS